MKRLVTVLLATGISLFSMSSPLLAAGAQAYIYTVPAEGQVATKAALIYEQADGLRGFDVRLTFDPKVVQVVDAQPQTPGVQVALGSLFADALVAVNRVDNQKGEITLSAAKPGAEVTGTTDLMSFQLKGIAPGDPKLAIAPKGLTIVDKRMQEIMVGVDAGKLQVPGVGAAPIPEQPQEKPLLRGKVAKLEPPKPEKNSRPKNEQGKVEIKPVAPTAKATSEEPAQAVVKNEAARQKVQETAGVQGDNNQLGKNLTLVGAFVLAVMVGYQVSRRHMSRRRRRRK